jgi:hypothetical protein
MFVVSLDIDPTGKATERIPDLEKSAQLHNTLLQGLFPDIRVARLNVPGGVLEESQQALVEQTMKRVDGQGRGDSRAQYDLSHHRRFRALVWLVRL